MHERRMAGRTGRAVARPARVARTHAPRVLLAAVALIVLLLQTGTAYALPGSEKNSYPLGDILMYENIGANRGAVVYGAANEFFATLCLIGRKSDYLQLSNDQLAELSNEGSGGAFWELSQRWNNLASDGPPENWPIGITLAMQGQGLISDPAYIWYADYSYYESDSLYNRAKADYLTIYNGGHLGGGSGSAGVVSGMQTNVNIGVLYSNRKKNFNIEPWTVYFTDEQFVTDLNAYLSANGYDNVFIGSAAYGYGGSSSRYYLIFGQNEFSLTPVETSGDFLQYSINTTGCKRYTLSTGPAVSIANHTITFNVSNFRSSNMANVTADTVINYTDSLTSEAFGWMSCVLNSGGGVFIPPNNNWPEPDPEPQPDPPDVPEPDEPTGPGIDPPNPIGYTIDPTDDPDPVTDPYVVVVSPDSQDIIPWLRAILQAINNVGDKLNDESTELQRALNDVFFGNLSKLLKNIKGEFLQDFTQWLDLELEWMMESIESLFLDLQDYLHDLFEWLADQMNFEFDISTDPYDDTSLLNWLRRIYNKLGSDGGPNTRPVDPSTDPEGFLDWLRRMIAEFILGLGASASDFVSDLGDLLSRLFAKFPFSVPWDLLGILGLLDAAPVAPRANFTIPLTIGNQEFNWTVDINLTGWSTYMESVRTIILVSFISWLAWLTPSVLRDLDPGDFL